VTIVLVILVVVAMAFRMATAEDRTRLLQTARGILEEVVETAVKIRELCKPFDEMLRGRLRWAWVTWALAGLNVAIFLRMLIGAGALANPQTLVSWGASFGPRTTNGEWWRLLTMMFVHAGMVSLAINVGALLQVGSMLERFIGRLGVIVVYVASGICASLMALSASPVSATFGAGGGVCGLYGVLFAWMALSAVKRSSVIIPRIVIKRLVPVTVLFALYTLASSTLGVSAQFGAMVIGAVAGIVYLVGAGDSPASWQRVAVIGVSAAAMVVAAAYPLRGMVDVRPEIARVVAIESSTSEVYKTALDRFRKGRIGTDALVQTIDRTIVPELQAADARLKTYDHVPPEHQPLVTGAQEYLRLREESWRLRAEGLRNIMASTTSTSRKTSIPESTPQVRAEERHRTNVATLGKAEATERSSLEALARIKPDTPAPAVQPPPAKH